MAKNGKLVAKIKFIIDDELLHPRHETEFHEIVAHLWSAHEIEADDGVITEALEQLKNEGVAMEIGEVYYRDTPEDQGEASDA